jgi:hypothetical protein
MGPSAHADPDPNEKPEVIEHSNRKVSKVLLLVTTILIVVAICILLRYV